MESYADKLDKKDSAGRYTRMGFHPLFGDFGYEGWVMNAKSSLWDDDYENPRANNSVCAVYSVLVPPVRKPVNSKLCLMFTSASYEADWTMQILPKDSARGHLAKDSH